MKIRSVGDMSSPTSILKDRHKLHIGIEEDPLRQEFNIIILRTMMLFNCWLNHGFELSLIGLRVSVHIIAVLYLLFDQNHEDLLLRSRQLSTYL